MAKITALILAHKAEDLIRCTVPLSGYADEKVIVDLSGKAEGEGVIRGSEKIWESLNLGLSKVKTEWVIYLHSEEVISQPSLAKLANFINKTEYDALRIGIREFTNSQNISGWKPSNAVSGYSGYVAHSEVRVWKTSQNLRFSEGVRPQILPALQQQGAKIALINDIKIHSYGADTAMTMAGLKEAYDKNPTDVKNAYSYGVALLHAKGWEAAHQIFSTLSQNNAMYRNTLTNLGIAKLNMGDAQGAAKAFLSALKDNPKDVLALNNLASVFYTAGKYDRAEQLYQQAISIDRRDPRLLRALINTYLKQDKKFEAKRLLSMAQKMHPKNPLLELEIN